MLRIPPTSIPDIHAIDSFPDNFVAPRADPVARARRRQLLSGAEVKAGYLAESAILEAVYNRTLAALLLAVLLPLFLCIALLMKLTTQGPLFYRGPRLGRNRQVFQMYKFRTLELDANRATRDRTLPRHNLQETPIGTYLRLSRLDELPQLLNILRGDMVFYGPRPIRAELEDTYAAAAPGYAIRFSVKPGLIGLAQAAMTHETPKSVRARLTAVCCRAPVNYTRQTLFILYVGLCVLRRTAVAAFTAAGDMSSPVRGRKWLRSGFSTPPASRIELPCSGGTQLAMLSGISDEAVQFICLQPLIPGHYTAELVRRRRDGKIARVRIGIDLQMVVPVGVGHPGLAHFASYRVDSDYARYMIERYFLRSAVVPS